MKVEIIQRAEVYVKQQLENDASGHDWYHIDRVRKLALRIGRKEDANLFICELAALFHDLADEKLVESEEEGMHTIEKWLTNQDVSKNDILHILSIIKNMSFKGGNGGQVDTIEGKVVQDADRLDAIGAIGIGRTFAYGGTKGHLMYDPLIKPRDVMSKEEYRTGKSTTVNHFYEKLLKLKDLMNTDEGKRIAKERHGFMESFLEQFFQEWEGKEHE